MKPSAQTTFAERIGRTLGRLRQGLMRLDQKAHGELVAQGLPPGVANVVLLVVKLVTLGMLAYAAFWLALLLVFVVVAAWVAPNSAYNESEEWAIGDQADHKRTVFYDPINYDDDPDPRFRDER